MLRMMHIEGTINRLQTLSQLGSAKYADIMMSILFEPDDAVNMLPIVS
jgi:hypothetical protein